MENLTEEQLKKFELYKKASATYYDGEEIISDTEFDELEKYLLSIECKELSDIINKKYNDKRRAYSSKRTY